MSNGLSTIERALQLARGGSCRTVDDVRRRLKTERYDGVDAHLKGSLQKQVAAELVKYKPVAKPN